MTKEFIFISCYEFEYIRFTENDGFNLLCHRANNDIITGVGGGGGGAGTGGHDTCEHNTRGHDTRWHETRGHGTTRA